MKNLLEKVEKIAQLKARLAASDYIAIKYAEGLLTESEYAKTREQRSAWRAEINAIETELALLRER